MTLGASSSTAAGFLSAVFQAVPFSISALYVVPHVGAPGGAGTANPAVMTTRENVSAAFATAPSLVAGNEQIVNDSVLGPWPAATAAESWTHVSFWTAPTGGTFVGSGTISTQAVSIGDVRSVPIGDCTITMPVAA